MFCNVSLDSTVVVAIRHRISSSVYAYVIDSSSRLVQTSSSFGHIVGIRKRVGDST
jgi:hypothetical protein